MGKQNAPKPPIDTNWILGGLFLAAECVIASAYLIVQALILKKYPVELIVAFFYCFFVAIQSAVTCLAAERDISAWSLEPKLKLLAVLYSGVFGYAFQVGVSTWCLHQTGPVFVSLFKPVGIVISVVAWIILLGDALYLGSLVGATAIVVGFYSVLWGKAKDIEGASARNSESIGKQTPLLKENSSEEILRRLIIPKDATNSAGKYAVSIVLLHKGVSNKFYFNFLGWGWGWL